MNNRQEIIMAFILVIGLIFAIVYFTDGRNSEDKLCKKPGCVHERAEGSEYCYAHKPSNTRKTYNSYDSDRSTYSGNESSKQKSDTSASKDTKNTNTNADTGKSSGSNSTKKTSKGGNKTVYNTLNNDPADYDDPEEYADDAWGDDFEDWDEAYDYWEDY